jgi:hypothetical protein
MNKDLVGCYLILMVFRTDLRHETQLALRRGELKPGDMDLLLCLKYHWTGYAHADRIDFVDLDGTTTTMRVRRQKQPWARARLVTIDDLRR